MENQSEIPECCLGRLTLKILVRIWTTADLDESDQHVVQVLSRLIDEYPQGGQKFMCEVVSIAEQERVTEEYKPRWDSIIGLMRPRIVASRG